MEALRTCSKCGHNAYTSKQLEDFTSNKECLYGRTNECKKCRKKHRNKERWGEVQTYKCTAEEYNERMASSVCCQVCYKTEDLVYDHCHTTMKFRGVLCRSCNRHIGGLGDNLEGILRVVKYLAD